MSNPNERQVGGSHYKTSVEHWDFVESQGMGYLEGCATKYVTRWRKKDGFKDLEKALHYVEKLISLHSGSAGLRRNNRATVVDPGLTERFLEANQLPLMSLEATVIYSLLEWQTNKELITARAAVMELIEEAKLNVDVQD